MKDSTRNSHVAAQTLLSNSCIHQNRVNKVKVDMERHQNRQQKASTNLWDTKWSEGQQPQCEFQTSYLAISQNYKGEVIGRLLQFFLQP